MTRIAEIEAREKAATKGPFVLPAYGNGLVAIVTKAGALARNVVADKVLLVDADFISHAREDIPYLLVQLREAEEKLKAAKALVYRLMGWDSEHEAPHPGACDHCTFDRILKGGVI